MGLPGFGVVVDVGFVLEVGVLGPGHGLPVPGDGVDHGVGKGEVFFQGEVGITVGRRIRGGLGSS